MSTQNFSTQNVKAAYTKPTLIEYGSLAERTKIFGLPDGPNALVVGPTITTGSPSTTTVTV